MVPAFGCLFLVPMIVALNEKVVLRIYYLCCEILSICGADVVRIQVFVVFSSLLMYNF